MGLNQRAYPFPGLDALRRDKGRHVVPWTLALSLQYSFSKPHYWNTSKTAALPSAHLKSWRHPALVAPFLWQSALPALLHKSFSLCFYSYTIRLSGLLVRTERDGSVKQNPKHLKIQWLVYCLGEEPCSLRNTPHYDLDLPQYSFI